MTNQLNDMIASSNVRLKTDHWFSREEQKKLVLKMASQMFVEFDDDAEEAIDKAQHFVDTFYNAKMNPDTWR